jgi:hypothetical protein
MGVKPLSAKPADEVELDIGDEIGDEISQCLWTSGIGYNYRVTSGYQVTAESACYVPGS